MYSKLRSIDVALIHQRSLAWLQESVAQSTSRHNVIVTYHAPSLQSVPARFKGDMLTAAYASNLEPVIADLAPDAWLHGHNSSDYWIQNCRVVCNPRGYPHQCNLGFDPALLIEVGGKARKLVNHAPLGHEAKGSVVRKDCLVATGTWINKKDAVSTLAKYRGFPATPAHLAREFYWQH